MIFDQSPRPEELMEFIYRAPFGLAKTDLEGRVIALNPRAVALLMPLAKKGDNLANLFVTLESVAPELRQIVDAFDKAFGVIVHHHRIVIASGIRGQTEPVFYGLSLVKLEAGSLVATLEDVSEQVRSERLLRKQEAWMNAMLAGVRDFAQTVVNVDGEVVLWNQEMCRLTGFSEAQVTGQPYSVFFPPDGMTTDRVTDRLREADRAGLSFDEGWAQRADGSRFWSHSLLMPLESSLRAQAYSLVMRDITDSRESIESLLKAATSDQLTGVANRRALFESAELEFARYARKARDISLLIIDIDHFKRINDTYGHPVGDEAIRTLALTIVRSVRSIDVVARLGGEEFAVFLPSTDITMAAEIAKRIRHNVAGVQVRAGDAMISFQVSIGAAQVGLEIASMDALIGAADEALYDAKRGGRDQVCVWKGNRSAQSARAG